MSIGWRELKHPPERLECSLIELTERSLKKRMP